MRYLLLCLLLVGCALSPDRAKQMSQEDLCYAAGDSTDSKTYQAAINELNSRKLDCGRWINHIEARQRYGDSGYYDKYFLRCNGPGDTYVYCAAASNSDFSLVTPIGPTNTRIPPMYIITK
jgi:hypothetical protein